MTRPDTWFSRTTVHIGPTLMLLVILLLGFGLRLYRLGDQSVWWDEGHAVWTARHDLYGTTRITAYDVHPPLYLWLLNIWLRLAGDSEFSIRYLSLIGGILTVALVYVVARRLIGRRAALLATLLLATARFHIWWSQEARMYIWATFFALLSTCFFSRLRQGNIRIWWSYIFSSAAMLYTLYLSVLVLCIQNLFIVLTVWRKPRRRRTLFRWALSQLGIIFLYAPWLYMALPRIRTDTAKTPFTFAQVWQLYGTVLTTGISTNLQHYLWLVVTFGILAVAGIALFAFDHSQPQRYGFSGWEIALLLALPLILPPVIVYMLSIPRGFFYSPKPEARYLLLFAPFFYILVAGTLAGFWQKGKRWRILSVCTIVLVLSTFVSVLPAHYAGRYLRNDYQTAMQTLAAYGRPGDAILVVSGDRYPVFLYHYDRQFSHDDMVVYLMPRHNTTFTSENVDAELDPLHKQYARLWLASFERTLQDPDNVVEGWLNARRTPVLNVSQDYNYLRLYTLDGAAPVLDQETIRPQHLLPDHDNHGIIGYDLATVEFRPGDAIQPAFYVQTTGDANPTMYLVDDKGQIIDRQTTNLTPNANAVARVMATFPIYTYTAPGNYWFSVCPSSQAECLTIPAGRVTHSKHLPRRTPEVLDSIDIGNGMIQFQGYSLSEKTVRPGQTLDIDLHWQAEQRLDQDYTIFAHLLGPFNPATGGPVWAQHDSYPLDGGHPTTRWLPGQKVIDRRTFEIPPEIPAGTYQIEVGLYDARSGERLVVDGSEDNRILIAEVKITTN